MEQYKAPSWKGGDGKEHYSIIPYFYDGEGIPDDGEVLLAMEKWAMAWGVYALRVEMIKKNPPKTQEESDACVDELDSMEVNVTLAGSVLRNVLPGDVRFEKNGVRWNGGWVKLKLAGKHV